jgi:hypothetical protein
LSSQSYVIETVYSLKYTTKDPVSIPEIIRSLKSTEELLKRTPAFIEQTYKDIKVTNVDVYVEHLDTGSLSTDFIVKYVIGSENAEQLKIIWDNIMTNNQPLKLLVAAGVGALVTFGTMSALNNPTTPTQHIEAYEGSTVIVGSQVGLSADDISKVLNSITDKKKLAKESVDFLSPARLDGQATVEMSGIPDLTIKHDFVDEAPVEYTPPIPTEKSESYTNTPLFIAASDRDNLSSGWAGTVPNIVDKRVKFTLDEEVDPKTLHGRVNVNADIEIHSRYVPSSKKYEVKNVLITKVN